MIHSGVRMRQIYYSDLKDYDDLESKYLRVACRATISNGGILENEVMDEKGKMIQRYWIKIT